MTTGSTTFALRDDEAAPGGDRRPLPAPRATRRPTAARAGRGRSCGPSSESTAGSSEFASSTAVSTPRALPIPSFVMKSRPISARPVIEIATVTPAKITARPGRRAGGRRRVLRATGRRAGTVGTA